MLTHRKNWVFIRQLIFIAILTGNTTINCAVYLRGKGASFPNEVYKQWIPAYKAYRQEHISLEMTYDAVGSGNGKKAIKTNLDIEYAGTDSLLSEEDKTNYPDLITFPTMAGGVVLAYNIPNISSLRLTRDQVVGLYNGTYTYWNDTTFHESNPNITMPNQKIIVIARADKSGTTSIFTETLYAFNRNWTSGTEKVFSKGYNFDTDQPYYWGNNIISYFGQQNRGVSGLVMSFKYSITYLSVADAQEAGLLHATLLNKAGFYVDATSGTIQRAMDDNSGSSTELTFSLADGTSENSYPIAGFTHFIVYKTNMADCSSAKEFVRYVYWFMEEGDQRKVCEDKGMAPLSVKMVERITQNVLKVMTCNGQNVWGLVQNDILAENQLEETWLIPVAVTTPIVFLAIFGLVAYIVVQKIKMLKLVNRNDWNIPIEDILFFYDNRADSSSKSRLTGLKSIRSLTSFHEIPDGENIVGQILQWPGRWNSYLIGLRLLELKQFHQIGLEMKKCMIWMRQNIVHTNVVRFYGLTELEKDKYVISEYCSKGPMTDILQDQKFNLSNDFKYCLANDIASGMQFIHNHGIIHGNLKSSACLIDGRWIVKISDWEYVKLSSYNYVKENPTTYLRKHTLNSYGQHAASFEDFWIAPEILKSEFIALQTMETDVYSYSIILQEIFTREDPYVEHSEFMTPGEVVRAVVQNSLRPEVSSDTPLVVRQIMEIAWSDEPLCRPTFDQILKMFRQTRTKGISVLDAMMDSMEEYTFHLEQRIEEKSSELKIAKQNMDTMMSELLPATIVSHVSCGEAIEAKIHKCLGLIVTELIESDKLVTDLSPAEAFSYLNHLCAEIDILAKRYSAHRDSISGSFILINGLQDENETESEICGKLAHLCLDIATKTEKIQPPGTLENNLKVRIGVDIGCGITGVIGSSVPKFEALGSVFDNAQALARTSEPSRIHMSSGMWNKLQKIEGFQSKEAGTLSFQGKTMTTYWLTGRTSVHFDVPSEMSNDSGVVTEKHVVSVDADPEEKNSSCSKRILRTVACQTNEDPLNDAIANVHLEKSDISPQKNTIDTEYVSSASVNITQKQTTIISIPRGNCSSSEKSFSKRFLDSRKIYPTDQDT